MDISKIEAGEIIVNSQTFNFNDSMNKIYEMFLIQIQKKGLEFIFLKDPSIEFITNDEKLIGQILINILSNAIKFTEKGKIEFIVNNKNEFIEFIIKDDGIGISKDKLEYIFERFKQVDGNINRKYAGTGLGLAICKELTSMLSGKISVKSELDKGSEFSILIKKNLDKQDTNIPYITKDKDEKFIPKKIDKFEKKEHKNIIILNNDPMYYFEIVLKLKKKSFIVKQMSSLENLLQELENGKKSYDKIIIDLDFINQRNLKEFLKKKKINLLLATSHMENLDEDLKNSIEVILEKSQKDKFLETICL